MTDGCFGQPGNPIAFEPKTSRTFQANSAARQRLKGEDDEARVEQVE